MSLVGALADNTDTNSSPEGSGPGGDLVAWVMERVDRWRDDRDQKYEDLWGEYYRIWRGRWTEADRTRASERSRIVTPASSQALEMTVSELEEAAFGRGNWIDVLDDQGDPDHTDIGGLRLQLLSDLDENHVPESISQCFLNGGLLGAMAGKIVVEAKEEPQILTNEDEETGTQVRTVEYVPVTRIKVIPIPLTDLIWDPDGEFVEDMLGIVHEVTKPRAWLLGQPWGTEYAAGNTRAPGAAEDDAMSLDDVEHEAHDPNNVLVTEYHGKVPRQLLEGPKTQELDADDPLRDALVGDSADGKELDGDGEMVEAIVTILDGHHLAQAIENPYLMKDRAIVAAPFEKVPGLLVGRGVMEKGYNPQKALDAEVRTRMDVMALIANPMMAADQSALPRGFDMRVRPGKTWITNGEPGKALQAMSFPNLDPSTFNQSSEMERMVQMGTGAMDTATPLGENRRNETATGSSLIAGTFVKRSKRSLRQITKNFINPLVQKIIWRYMQYDADRYPTDIRFRVVSTLGIVAREIEQNQMTQMLGLVADSKPQTAGVITQAIFDNSSTPYKEAITQAIAKDNEPDPQQVAFQNEIQKMQIAAARADLQNKNLENARLAQEMKKTEAEILKLLAEVESELAKPGTDRAKLQNEFRRLEIDLGELRQFARQNDISLLKVVGDQQNATASNDRPNAAQ